MNEQSKVVIAPTLPIGGLLGITLIILKLCGVISWSWLWVLSPFWIPLALCLAIFGGIVLVGAIVAGIAALVFRCHFRK